MAAPLIVFIVDDSTHVAAMLTEIKAA